MEKDLLKPFLNGNQNISQIIQNRINKSKNLKIALCSIPEMGHCLPLIHIGEELLNRGHEVYFISGNIAKETHLKSMTD